MSHKNLLASYLANLFQSMSWRLIGVLVLMLLISFSEGIGLVLLIPLLQLVKVEVAEGAVGNLAQGVGQVFGYLGLKASLLSVLGAYVLIIAARAALYRYEQLVSIRLQQDFIRQLRQKLYRAIGNSNWLFLSRSRSSDFSHALTSELERVEGLTGSLLYLLVQAVMALAYAVLAFYLSPQLSLFALAAAVLLIFLLRRHTQLSQNVGERASQAYRRLYAAISDHIAALKVTKSHAATERHAAAFDVLGREVAESHVASMRAYADVQFWFNLGSVLVLAAFVFFAFEVLVLPTATVLLMLYLFARLMPIASNLQSSYQQLLNLLPSFSNLKHMQEACEAEAEVIAATQQPLKLERCLRFERVGFSYSELPVLQDLMLEIPAGQITALVGSSGGGKSTLADLAAGLLSPLEGRLWLDDLALTADKLLRWRQSIGYVDQETVLLHDTIRANLLLAQPKASEADLWQALRLAAALEFVIALPQGLETVVGDRGLRLSGGERQRLALARALLRQPSLLILDEATSALDLENERRIFESIGHLRGQMTILIIAHRLASLQRVDLIYVIDKGAVVESGDFVALLQKQNYFHALFKAQSFVE